MSKIIFNYTYLEAWVNIVHLIYYYKVIVFSLEKIRKCLLNFSGKDTDSSALEEEGDDFKALEAKLRCMAIKKKPSQGKLVIFVKVL